MQMKTWLTRKSNILFLLLFAFLLWRQVPLLLNNMEFQGSQIQPTLCSIIEISHGDNEILFPPNRSKSIVIFWASWCGPCKIEMERLKTSIKNGKMPSNLIFAINPFEPIEVIRKFITSHDYPFTYIEAPHLAKDLNIEVTPTTLFIDENAGIASISSGMSILGIWKAERFFK
jgi:cytochrome c biogenesis protein CcmG, thiol:disulfide interchange protein DsbE